MIERQAETLIERRLAQFRGVVLLGPRQIGETAPAAAIAARRPGALILYLERESDRAALS